VDRLVTAWSGHSKKFFRRFLEGGDGDTDRMSVRGQRAVLLTPRFGNNRRASHIKISLKIH
jgi:hypothetical protein